MSEPEALATDHPLLSLAHASGFQTLCRRHRRLPLAIARTSAEEKLDIGMSSYASTQLSPATLTSAADCLAMVKRLSRLIMRLPCEPDVHLPGGMAVNTTRLSSALLFACMLLAATAVPSAWALSP